MFFSRHGFFRPLQKKIKRDFGVFGVIQATFTNLDGNCFPCGASRQSHISSFLEKGSCDSQILKVHTGAWTNPCSEPYDLITQCYEQTITLSVCLIPHHASYNPAHLYGVRYPDGVRLQSLVWWISVVWRLTVNLRVAAFANTGGDLGTSGSDSLLGTGHATIQPIDPHTLQFLSVCDAPHIRPLTVRIASGRRGMWWCTD